jgi:hypothetical protein
VLKVTRVSYGPRPVPISTEVLKKRKVDDAAKVLGKCPKVTKKKGVVPAKVSGSWASADSKRPSGVNILPTKSVKLSKGTVPRAIASVATTRIMLVTRVSEVSSGVGGAKGDGGHPNCTILPKAKAAPSAKKRIISAIGALAALSSDGSEGSSPHDPTPEVQSTLNRRGPLAKPQARSATTSRSRPTLEVCLRIVPSAGAAGASTGCL